MTFKDISYLKLWWPFRSMHRNNLCNFGKGHHEKHFRELDLILDQWFRRFCFKDFLSRALVALVFSRVNYFYWPSKAVLLLWIICVICVLCLSCVRVCSLPALWSPEGKGLTSWLWCVMFIVILLLSHLVSWDRCGTWLCRFLIRAVFLTL